MVNPKRIRQLNKNASNTAQSPGPAIYWMSRDQRMNDNWALLYAQELAQQNDTWCCVVFCLQDSFLDATQRQFSFMVTGLQELEKTLQAKNIPFTILIGEPQNQLTSFSAKIKASSIVTDFSPLRIARQWKKNVAHKVAIPIYEVDTHNIVPVWVTSDRQEYAARTIRPKITKHSKEFFTEFPSVDKQKRNKDFSGVPKIQWSKISTIISKLEKDPYKVSLAAGEQAAKKTLNFFIDQRLKYYDERKNDPTANAVSSISPYLHFGHIAAQRVALAIQQSDESKKTKDTYLEELIIRRELADNYCYYNNDYDNFNGFPDWAQKSLKKHTRNKRAYVYTKNEFEKAETHDELWNAAQLELLLTGTMHGYMRMYWAKKILEWTNTPEYAQKIAIYLNDKYQMDGRDPNGYTGIAWSIGGVHDRPWFERPIYGTVRYMNANGARRKFNVDLYIEKFSTKR